MQKRKGRERVEVIIEAVVWLAILMIAYFGLMFLFIVFYEEYYPIFILNHPDAMMSVLRFQQTFFVSFTLMYLVGSVAFVVWRIYRRRRTIQLGYILEELHYISQGHYDHRIEIDKASSMEPVVNSINRLVDSTVKAMEEERRIEQSKDELITNMSHDIRTPLTSVIGYLGLLQGHRYKSEDQANQYAQIAYDKALQLQRMVEDLFEYTKVRQVNTALTIDKVNVPHMLAQLAVEFEIEANEVGRSIIVDAPQKDLYVEMDSEKMVRVFANLLTNAFKYGGCGKWVRLTVEQQPEVTRFTVANDGNQIDDDVLNNLFQRFYRGDPSRNQGIKGSGLGLAITESIVTLHHGRIWAESDEESTRFIFELPNTYTKEGL
ncbi:MAG: HAMP domain-containing histidine kinase [Aerococcus suis]|nr:HAMP domain-containing histidine kinase [Aerococcus suis]